MPFLRSRLAVCSAGWRARAGWQPLYWQPVSRRRTRRRKPHCSRPRQPRRRNWTARCCRSRSRRFRIARCSMPAMPRPPPRFQVKAPACAPNVLIVLIDDMGFGMSSAFGGPINMPTVDRLAKRRAALQPFPHHGTLLADAGGAADRPQSSHVQHGVDHGNRHVLSRPNRTASE